MFVGERICKHTNTYVCKKNLEYDEQLYACACELFLEVGTHTYTCI